MNRALGTYCSIRQYLSFKKWLRFRIYLYTVFTRISAAVLIKFFAPQMRRLLEGGAYLKIFSFNLTVYFLSVRKFYST